MRLSRIWLKNSGWSSSITGKFALWARFTGFTVFTALAAIAAVTVAAAAFARLTLLAVHAASVVAALIVLVGLILAGALVIKCQGALCASVWSVGLLERRIVALRHSGFSIAALATAVVATTVAFTVARLAATVTATAFLLGTRLAFLTLLGCCAARCRRHGSLIGQGQVLLDRIARYAAFGALTAFAAWALGAGTFSARLTGFTCLAWFTRLPWLAHFAGFTAVNACCIVALLGCRTLLADTFGARLRFATALAAAFSAVVSAVVRTAFRAAFTALTATAFRTTLSAAFRAGFTGLAVGAWLASAFCTAITAATATASAVASTTVAAVG